MSKKLCQNDSSYIWYTIYFPLWRFRNHFIITLHTKNKQWCQFSSFLFLFHNNNNNAASIKNHIYFIHMWHNIITYFFIFFHYIKYVYDVLSKFNTIIYHKNNWKNSIFQIYLGYLSRRTQLKINGTYTNMAHSKRYVSNSIMLIGNPNKLSSICPQFAFLFILFTAQPVW